MKRAIFMLTLALGLTLGSATTFAFPNGPCAPPVSPSTEASFSGVQVLWLVLPILVSSIG